MPFFFSPEGVCMAKLAQVAVNEDIPQVVSTKKIRQDLLKRIEPKTPAQVMAFNAYRDRNLVMLGSAGTGKTFIGMYLAMKEVLSRESGYTKLTVVRSAVPVRDLGFMPGTKEEKEAVYEMPYHSIFKEIFHQIQGNGLVEKLKDQHLYEFISTSYIRGITMHDTIILVDECENMTYQELSSIITRMGDNCKIMFCGDFRQSDLQKKADKDGLVKFLAILRKIYDFSFVEFNREDIVRSSIVKQFIIAEEQYEEENGD
jgi:phosphate starvation-inducible protein PhoH